MLILLMILLLHLLLMLLLMLLLLSLMLLLLLMMMSLLLLMMSLLLKLLLLSIIQLQHRPLGTPFFFISFLLSMTPPRSFLITPWVPSTYAPPSHASTNLLIIFEMIHHLWLISAFNSNMLVFPGPLLCLDSKSVLLLYRFYGIFLLRPMPNK